jgi:DNA-binding ferritin-like protein
MEENSLAIAEFVSTLLASRNQAHVYHWQAQNVGSFSAHKALNEYYDEIVDLVDGLVESYQGKYGIVRGYSVSSNIREDGSYKMYFDALSKYVELKRQRITQDSYIQNQIDEIVGLIESTKYKLINLI